MNDQALLQQWNAIAAQKKQLEEQERALRLEVAKRFFSFDENGLQKGTNRMPLPGDATFDLKCTFTVNTHIEQARVNEVLSELERAGVPPEIRAEVFRFKAELSAKVYGMLHPGAQDIVDSIITRSAGMPQVAIEAAKTKNRQVAAIVQNKIKAKAGRK